MQRRRGLSATARGILSFISFGITRIGIDSHRIDCCILLELLGSDAHSGYLHLVILLHSTFSSVFIYLRCRNLLEGISSDPIVTNSFAAHLHTPLQLIQQPLQFSDLHAPHCVFGLHSKLLPRFVIYRRSKLLHQPKKSLYKPPSAVRRRWTLSLSDGTFDTLLKITTRHTINFHEYTQTAIWPPRRRNGRKKRKRRDGTGRQDRICGVVGGLRMPSLPLLLPCGARGQEGLRVRGYAAGGCFSFLVAE